MNLLSHQLRDRFPIKAIISRADEVFFANYKHTNDFFKITATTYALINSVIVSNNCCNRRFHSTWQRKKHDDLTATVPVIDFRKNQKLTSNVVNAIQAIYWYARRSNCLTGINEAEYIWKSLIPESIFYHFVSLQSFIRKYLTDVFYCSAQKVILLSTDDSVVSSEKLYIRIASILSNANEKVSFKESSINTNTVFKDVYVEVSSHDDEFLLKNSSKCWAFTSLLVDPLHFMFSQIVFEDLSGKKIMKFEDTAVSTASNPSKQFTKGNLLAIKYIGGLYNAVYLMGLKKNLLAFVENEKDNLFVAKIFLLAYSSSKNRKKIVPVDVWDAMIDSLYETINVEETKKETYKFTRSIKTVIPNKLISNESISILSIPESEKTIYQNFDSYVSKFNVARKELSEKELFNNSFSSSFNTLLASLLVKPTLCLISYLMIAKKMVVLQEANRLFLKSFAHPFHLERYHLHAVAAMGGLYQIMSSTHMKNLFFCSRKGIALTKLHSQQYNESTLFQYLSEFVHQRQKSLTPKQEIAIQELILKFMQRNFENSLYHQSFSSHWFISRLLINPIRMLCWHITDVGKTLDLGEAEKLLKYNHKQCPYIIYPSSLKAVQKLGGLQCIIRNDNLSHIFNCSRKYIRVQRYSDDDLSESSLLPRLVNLLLFFENSMGEVAWNKLSQTLMDMFEKETKSDSLSDY